MWLQHDEHSAALRHARLRAIEKILRAGVETLRLQTATGEAQTYDVLKLINEAVRCV